LRLWVLPKLLSVRLVSGPPRPAWLKALNISIRAWKLYLSSWPNRVFLAICRSRFWRLGLFTPIVRGALPISNESGLENTVGLNKSTALLTLGALAESFAVVPDQSGRWLKPP